MHSGVVGGKWMVASNRDLIPARRDRSQKFYPLDLPADWQGPAARGIAKLELQFSLPLHPELLFYVR